VKHFAICAVLLLSVAGHAAAQSPLEEIATLAEKSKCAAIDWKNRGTAPKAYMRGMALVFARAVCQADRADVKIVSGARGKPGTAADRTDALTWYDAKFVAANMPNDKDGIDTLRHTYALMIGLGMQESSGAFCTGRDQSQNFNQADTAEAGLFQTSFGVSRADRTLIGLFDQYTAKQDGCLLDVFSKNVKCKPKDAENSGTGKGADWQQLTKTCPAFATEYAAVVVRKSGGGKGEFNPIRKRVAELRTECDAMLSQVQAIAQSKPEVCAALK
jgi:hypothetical protein